jgi:hypothetical protein
MLCFLEIPGGKSQPMTKTAGNISACKCTTKPCEASIEEGGFQKSITKARIDYRTRDKRDR